jgi:erythromycin esterase
MFPGKPFLLWGLLIAASACGCARAKPSDTQAFIEWTSKHAVSIESLDSPLQETVLSSLRNTIGPARVVGLGESRHDTREQLLLKGLIVRHLIADLGFRALILEESFPHAESLDRYVTSGEGDLRLLMNSLAGWYLWDTEEMLELVQWIRRFNEDRGPDRKVRIFGMDITAPALGVQEVLDYLESADVDARLDAQALGLDLHQGDFWPGTWRRYASLPNERRRELAANYDKLIELLEERKGNLVAFSSEKEYERILLLAELGRKGNALFSSTDRAKGGEIREHGMAECALWILDREVAGEKAIIWSHNLHVAKSAFQMPDLAEGELEPMGVLMAEAPVFLIDLRGVEKNSGADGWLRSNREWRAQDSMSMLVPSDAFDLVYFVRNISRSRPTPLALRRFQAMGEQR